MTSLVSFVCFISDPLSLLCQYGHQYLSDVWVLIQAVGFEVKKTTSLCFSNAKVTPALYLEVLKTFKFSNHLVPHSKTQHKFQQR